MRGFWILAASALAGYIGTGIFEVVLGVNSFAGGLALMLVACVAGLAGVTFNEQQKKIVQLEKELRDLGNKDPETAIMKR